MPGKPTAPHDTAYNSPSYIARPPPKKREKQKQEARSKKKMSQMKMFSTMERMMEQSIEEAVRETFRTGRSSGDAADDVDAFVHSLLVRLGLRSIGEPLIPYKARNPQFLSDVEAAPAPAAAAEVSAPASVEASSDGEGKDSRKRTVSKKMKDTFLAMEGGTEEQLKAAMRMYKAADQAQIDAWGGKWDAFARAFLAGECTLAKKPRAKASPKPKAAAAAAAPDAPKKEKAPKEPKEPKNFTWTPTAKKLFAEVVEGNGGTVTDALKSEFVAHVNAMDGEEYKAIAPVGHVRAFVGSKAVSAAAATAPAPAPAPAAEDDDEDLEEIEVEGETLTIGVTSGKIYRPTEDSGDVQIGVAGQGKFAGVKIPSA